MISTSCMIVIDSTLTTIPYQNYHNDQRVNPQPDLTVAMPILRIRYVYDGLIYQLWQVDEF